MGRVVVVGSSNTDMVVGLPRLPEVGQTVLGGELRTGQGGKGANRRQRRAGAEVVLVAAVGGDPFGRDAIQAYRDEAIDVSFMKVVDGQASGVALILVDERGENMIAVDTGANRELCVADVERLPESLFAAGDVLLVSLEIPLETACAALERGRRSGMPAILNPAPVPVMTESGAATGEGGGHRDAQSR